MAHLGLVLGLQGPYLDDAVAATRDEVLVHIS